ncbi:MAG: RnfABCDGE type electron transport complex subunit G [Bacteroidales bacterium]
MAKKESTFGNMVMTLFIVTAVAALALGGVYNVTKEPIAKARKLKIQKAIAEVLPQFDTVMELKVMPTDGKDSLTFYHALKDGEPVGTAVRTYTDKGFGGRVWIMVGFTDGHIIHGTSVLEHKETPGLGDKMDPRKSPWSEQFKGVDLQNFDLRVKKDGGDVDAITAATISSRAFCDATKRAWEALQQSEGR